MNRWTLIWLGLGLALGLGLWPCVAMAADELTPAEKAAMAKEAKPAAEGKETKAADLPYVAPGTQAAVDKAVAYLRKTQLEDGGWPIKEDDKKGNLGITDVAVLGLLRAGIPANDPMLEKALKFIVGFQREDGGICGADFQNYTTSLSVMVMKATGDKKYDEPVLKAVKFLRGLQWGDGQGLTKESPDWGGTGYSEGKPPDMSNQQMYVQALNSAGVSSDDPSMQAALVFVSRCQGTEEAKGYWKGLPDGGFTYKIHGAGESKAGDITLPDGTKGLKTYGSMTYAGFLSLIYAGLKKDDFRVKAALGWIGKHWTVEENPEMGKQGLYYYLMTMGKALQAYGAPTIMDDKGNKHEWRKELSARLVGLQQADGSYINDADRWQEGIKPLVTGYALIALGACKTELKVPA